MLTRHIKWVVIAICAVSFAAAGCSDDSSTASGEGSSNNGGGANNAADSDHGGGSDDSGGQSTDGDHTDGDHTDGGNNGANNGTCSPSVIFSEVYQPNVYLMLDRSQSMEGEPMTQAKAGLDAVADQLAQRIRFGVGAYPFPSAGCGMANRIGVGANSAADLQESWRELTAAGGTPTGTAIFQVRDRGLLEEDADDHDDKREKALVVITDGDPTVCEDEHATVEEAQKIAEDGVPVFVVGFRSEANPDNLNALAEAGGTDAPGSDRFYTANNTDELTGAIDNISSDVISCSRPLDPAPESADLLSVEIDGNTVPQSSDDGFSYAASSGELKVHGTWCDQLQDAARDGTVLKITVNCPDCVAAGEACSDASECCGGRCDDGVCTSPCQRNGDVCEDSGDCCSGTCGVGGELTGTCIDG
ncbi:MAG: VWA domain-containing protein [Persicimonas sp.]